MSSTQEEADTHIVLHALNADKLYRENKVKGRIVVKSPDTDVLVLLIHYFPQMTSMCEVWFQTGMVTSIKDCRRYILVHELCKSLNSVVCIILPVDVTHKIVREPVINNHSELISRTSLGFSNS